MAEREPSRAARARDGGDAARAAETTARAVGLARPEPAARPVRAGTQRTRDTILAAATASFAEKGYDGARIDEIALRAGVPKNLLYYHFGDKDGLFTAVLESVYDAIRTRQDALRVRDLDPVEGVRQLVLFTGRVWAQHPEFLRLLHSENLHDARHISASPAIASMYSPLMEALRDLLARGERAGVFRRGVDPIELYISISSLSAHYISNHRTLEAVMGVRLMGASRLKRRLDHAAEMVLAWLSPGQPQRPGRSGRAKAAR